MIPKHLSGVELFRWLKANKSELVSFKKKTQKQSTIVSLVPLKIDKSRTAKKWLYENDEEAGILKRTIVMNTYNWLDDHDDVHNNNLFAKSLKERGGSAPHLHDHIFQLGAKVGSPIRWFEEDINWDVLGVNKTGATQALLLESAIKRSLDKKIYKMYLDDEIDQHSVSMSYIKLDMAINDPDYEDEYKTWVDTIDDLGNPQKAIDQGYYWHIKEAALHEGSAVLAGSNELTPTLDDKSQPPSTEIKSEPHVALDVKELMKSYI